MRARYLGDHSNFTSWGIRFPRGVFVAVDDPHAQKKIAGNSHFEVKNSDAEDVDFVETIAPVAAPVAAAPDITPIEPAQQNYSGARRGPKPKHK